jgi:hypothetical protein
MSLFEDVPIRTNANVAVDEDVTTEEPIAAVFRRIDLSPPD